MNWRNRLSQLCARASTYERVIAAQCLVALALVCTIVIAFEYEQGVIWLHTLYVLELIFVQTLLVMGIVRVLGGRHEGKAQILVALMLAIMSGFLLLLYATNIASNIMWGGYINYSHVRDAFEHIHALAVVLGVNAATIYVALTFVLLMLFVSLYRPAKLIVKGFRVSSGRMALLGYPIAHTTRVVWATVGFSVYVGLYSVFALGHWTPSEYEGEPISSLFRTSDTGHENRIYLTAVAEQDARLRRSYKVPTDFDRRNVILITVDSLRASSLPLYGSSVNTPFLQALHRKGTLHVLPPAVSTCPESVCGIISTLSSRDYSRMTPGLLKLNELLLDAGYRVNFLLSGSHSWNGLRKLYGNFIHYYADGTSFSSHTLNDDRGVIDLLERQPDFSGQPTFFFLHLMSTHLLGRAARSAQTPDVGLIALPALKDEKRYDESVEAVDSIIAALFQLLERKGYLTNSLVVITGDHGEAFGEHGSFFGHMFTLYDESLRVPMLIYDPNGPSYHAPLLVSQLDIAPTIVDRLGLPVPRSWQGRSLLSTATAERVTIHQTPSRSPVYAVHYLKDGMVYKLITRKSMPGEFDKFDELYDLTHDPAEKKNIIAVAPPEILALIRNQLTDYQRSMKPIGLAKFR